MGLRADRPGADAGGRQLGAWRNGWTVRARGSAHGWSPLTITAGTPAIPASFGESTWGRAAGALDRLDPHHVLGNAFLDRLLR